MLTLSIIRADTGGYIGHSAVHPEMLALALRAIDHSKGGLILDGRVIGAPRRDDISSIRR